MNIILDEDRAVLLHGDCKDIGEHLDENSVDSIVTDPPAGIDFMGKGWDSDKGGRDKWIAWLCDAMKPSFRALKPGGYALVWALPRTSHWTATAVEDAGFEICDIHHHIFGTGFPKSLNLLKAFEAKFGAVEAAKLHEKLDGLGTALKPAVEHWILAQKPFEKTYAENFKEHGTGGLNVDACRIDYASDADRAQAIVAQTDFKHVNDISTHLDAHARNGEMFDPKTGRWPAHLSLDEFTAAILDEQSGELTSGARSGGVQQGRRNGQTFGDQRGGGGPEILPSKGGASRFFYIAKGSRSEKDTGLGHLEPKTGGEATGRADGSVGTKNPRAGAGRTGGARNFHPTVKSVALMRWLVRLVTPKGGVVLDPFIGSGTTGVAALAEGLSIIGVEQGGKDGEYLPILLGRIRHALSGIPTQTPDVLQVP